MTNLSTGVLLGLLWLGSSALASAREARAPAEQDGVVFRKDVFVRHADGYHTYRIPAMVATDTWPHTRVLSKALAGYSDMAITKDDRIFCVFENGIKDYCEKISVVEVDREWIAAGKPAQQEKKPK